MIAACCACDQIYRDGEAVAAKYVHITYVHIYTIPSSCVTVCAASRCLLGAWYVVGHFFLFANNIAGGVCLLPTKLAPGHLNWGSKTRRRGGLNSVVFFVVWVGFCPPCQRADRLFVSSSCGL